jgi:hypothetical protein
LLHEIAMTDDRQHRGRHPSDSRLFAGTEVPILRQATDELSWLFERKYSQTAALKLVGDHFGLRERQRLAVLRSACGARTAAERARRRLTVAELQGLRLAVDGFNCLITIEAALSGGLLLRGRDEALRDLSSVHGSYRQVQETERALQLLGSAIVGAGPTEVRWFLDRPVSNSGRLRGIIEAMAQAAGWPWQVELADNPDHAIAATGWVAASTDAWLLDNCPHWVCLPDTVVAQAGVSPWILDLG